MSVGLPDYYKMNVPTLSTLGKNQTIWYDLWTGDIVAGYFAQVIAGVVPSGYRLFITAGGASCSASGIQLLRLVGGIGEYLHIRYDKTGTLVLSLPLGLVLNAGDMVVYYVYNLDSEERSFSTAFMGLLEAV